MALKPAAAMSGTWSLMTLYQLCPRCDSQLKPCRMISWPSPAAGPELVAPPPCVRITVHRHLVRAQNSTAVDVIVCLALVFDCKRIKTLHLFSEANKWLPPLTHTETFFWQYVPVMHC